MSEQLAMDLARALRDVGMARSAEHAEREAPGWQQQAVSFIRSYAITHQEFMCESARRYAESQGIAPPPDKRAWGAAMMRAARSSIVKKIGWATASDPKVHMNPASLWKSLIFSPAAARAAETPAPSTVPPPLGTICQILPKESQESSYAK